MRRGFTLLELIMVIVIIGILALVALPRIFTNLENARRTEAFASMKGIRDAETAWFSVNNAFTAVFPIVVDIDADGINDITMPNPSSSNFTYSIAGAGTTMRVEASRAVAQVGRNSYGMCISTGETTFVPNAACPCDPGCL